MKDVGVMQEIIDFMPAKLFGFWIGIVYLSLILTMFDAIQYLIKISLVSNPYIIIIMTLGEMFILVFSFVLLTNSIWDIKRTNK